MATSGRGPSSPINVVAGGTVSSGDVIDLGGGLFGVAAADASSGEVLAVYTEGVFDLPKQSGFSIAAGEPVYFDAGADQRAENNPALLCVGYATQTAGSSATTVRTMLVQSLQPFGSAIKHNMAAGDRPAVTDDVTEGYGIGSRWFYQGVEWVCVDATAGAAKWRALNTLAASLTIASGSTTGTVALPTGAANGDHVQASQTADMTNEVAVSRAVASGGNAIVHLTGDPGASGATLAIRILPADVG